MPFGKEARDLCILGGFTLAKLSIISPARRPYYCGEIPGRCRIGRLQQGIFHYGKPGNAHRRFYR